MQLPGQPIQRLEGLLSKAQWKYFWIEPVFVPAISGGAHLHLQPPHIHLDLHLPFVVILIGNHGLGVALVAGHTGAIYQCPDDGCPKCPGCCSASADDEPDQDVQASGGEAAHAGAD